MGDLCFSRLFDIKEPGDCPLKAMPRNIHGYMAAYVPLINSPFLDWLIWLKPRGLGHLFDIFSPSSVITYNKFVQDSATDRIRQQSEEAKLPEKDRLRAEANLLIIAGSDTAAISLSGIFHYLTGSPRHLQKLTEEIRSRFASVDEIVPGPKLLNFTYLRACVDEGMRLTPTGPCESPRQVLKGGMLIRGDFYREGTIVGTPPWCASHNASIYGDPGVFRPERWMLDEANGVTRASLALLRSNFNPFFSGPTSCAGRNLAVNELLITVARTLHRLDVRRAPGSTLGCGSPDKGWGERDPAQLLLRDAYITLREGPEIQFRRRADMPRK